MDDKIIGFPEEWKIFFETHPLWLEKYKLTISRRRQSIDDHLRRTIWNSFLKLKNDIALPTGGLRGIGPVIAEALAKG